jgi:hypothetical protein
MIKITIKDKKGCLEEAMADLKAMKAKYKDDSVLSKIVDALEQRDPSGNHKYINWAMKQMEIAYMEGGFDDQSLSRDSVARVMARKVLRMGDLIFDFHNLSKKAAAWRDDAGKQLSKDLNSWTDIETLESDIETAKSAAARAKKEKEDKGRASKLAKEESDVIYDDEEFMVIRPLSAHASCYYGQGTKWCISATDSQNYFDSYTKEGKAFYFIMDKTRSNDDPLKKVAWVGNAHGHFEEFYNATDDEIGYDAAMQSMEETSPEKAAEIEADIDDHLNNNLPDNGWEEQVNETTEAANARMDHTTIGANLDGDDEYTSIYAYVTTNFVVHGNFDDVSSETTWNKKEDEIADIVYNAIRHDTDLEFDVYDASDNVEWEFKSGAGPSGAGTGPKSLYLRVGLRPDRSPQDPDEYSELANEAEVEIDDKNTELTELIRREFVEQNIIPSSFIDDRAEDLENERGSWEWDNVEVTYVGEELEYEFVVPGTKIAKDGAAMNEYVTSTIEIINKIATDLQRSTKKQLNLPGMEQEGEDSAQLIITPERDFHMSNVRQKYQIPVMGTVAKTGPAEGVGGGVKITVQNTNGNQTDWKAKMNYDVMKLMNEYPESFRKGIKKEIEALNQFEKIEPVTESKKRKINIIIESKKK